MSINNCLPEKNGRISWAEISACAGRLFDLVSPGFNYAQPSPGRVDVAADLRDSGTDPTMARATRGRHWLARQFSRLSAATTGSIHASHERKNRGTVVGPPANGYWLLVFNVA